MSMTKKTISTWERIPTREEDADLWAEREAFLQNAIQSGKTEEELPTMMDVNVYERYWIDESAANEWVEHLNGLTTKYSIAQTTTVENL